MKKFWMMLALVLCMCALAACGGGETPAEDEPAPAESAVVDEAAVMAAYDKGMEAFFWCDVGTMEVDYEDTVADGDFTYCRVKAFSTLAEFKDYLGTIFVPEIVAELLSANTEFIEENGKLYALDGGRGTDISYGADTKEVIANSDGSFTVKVTVDRMADDMTTITGTEVYEYPYEQVNGQWLFTAFPFYL